MESSVLKDVVLPLALAFIMLGMGLSLTLGDFGRVLKMPKAVAVGVAFQMLVLPVVALVIAKAFGLAPALAVGLMVLAFCPGGTTSNVISYLARGDLALSVTLTAVVSVVAPFTIPALTNAVSESYLGAGATVHLPYGKTLVQLLAISIVPIALGMGIHKKWPSLAAKAERPVRALSVLFLFLIIAGLVKQNWSSMPAWMAASGPATAALNVLTMTAGFLGAKALRLDRRQSITISIEVGIQNGTMALLVTSMLGNPEMDVAPAIYSLLMFFTGTLFAIVAARGPHEHAVSTVR